MKKYKYWYIKERHNPQLKTYYVALGNISAKEAKEYENSLYGYNIIHRYESFEEFAKALNEFARK